MAKNTAEVRERIEAVRSMLEDDLDRIGPVASQRMHRARRRLVEIGAVIGAGLALVLVFPILKVTRRRHARPQSGFSSMYRSLFGRR